MTAARIPLSYCGLPHRSDSLAPHSARLMMAGGWPGIMTPDGGVHCVLAGACGGGVGIPGGFCPDGGFLGGGLRRGDEDRGDVLPERLFLGSGPISEAAKVAGRLRGRLSHRGIERA